MNSHDTHRTRRDTNWRALVRQQQKEESRIIVYAIRWMITVMKADAGTADLDVTATSPSGQEIPLQVTPLNDGAEMIEFSPSVPGTYMINVTYGNYVQA